MGAYTATHAAAYVLASGGVKRAILAGKEACRCWKMVEESGMSLSPCCSTGSCIHAAPGSDPDKLHSDGTDFHHCTTDDTTGIHNKKKGLLIALHATEWLGEGCSVGVKTCM